MTTVQDNFSLLLQSIFDGSVAVAQWYVGIGIALAAVLCVVDLFAAPRRLLGYGPLVAVNVLITVALCIVIWPFGAAYELERVTVGWRMAASAECRGVYYRVQGWFWRRTHGRTGYGRRRD